MGQFPLMVEVVAWIVAGWAGLVGARCLRAKSAQLGWTFFRDDVGGNVGGRGRPCAFGGHRLRRGHRRAQGLGLQLQGLHVPLGSIARLADGLKGKRPRRTPARRGDDGRLWRKATCYRSLAQERILAAVCRAVLNLGKAVDPMVAFAQDMNRENGEIEKKTQEIQKHVDKLEQQAKTCARKCLEHPDSDAYEEIREQIEGDLRAVRAELQALRFQAGDVKGPLTREEILALVDPALKTLDGPEAWLLVRSLTTPIQAVPYQRIDCGLVVLRARFRLNLVALLPDQWKPLARRVMADLANNSLLTDEIEVDLFDEPGLVKFTKEALRLHWQDPPLTGEQIATQLASLIRASPGAVRGGAATRPPRTGGGAGMAVGVA